MTVPGGPVLRGSTGSNHTRDFGVYVHVPFCKARCGYCDFNTYVPASADDGPRGFADVAIAEMAYAAETMARAGYPERPARTVFFGGGTPTLLAPTDLARILASIRRTWGLVDGAEVTIEANPDTVTPHVIGVLAEAGFTRISVGMQSAVSHVLAALDRGHTPAMVPQVVEWAHEAGMKASVDLIYGTPGESIDDWRRSVDAALATGVTHLSAYALTLEPGTRMGEQIRRGALPAPDGDLQAEMYEIVDDAASAAGLEWYEISNWAVPGSECQHNLGYWRDADWWGLGPGAHSHLDGVRWWNVKHPRAWEESARRGDGTVQGQETLDPHDKMVERTMLGIRLRDGLSLEDLSPAGRQAVAGLIADGLVDGAVVIDASMLQLTRRGRLLTDTVVATLLV